MGTATKQVESRQSGHQSAHSAALQAPLNARSATSGRMVRIGQSASRGAWSMIVLNSLVLVAALALLLAWGGREVQAPWGETQGPVFSEAQVAQWSQEIVDEQVAALGCSKAPTLTDRVAVRNAVGFDQGVVRVVSFDEGFAAGQAGEVFVVGWCA